MAVFKCESCDGNLDVINSGGSRILECPYCGTQQTIPQTEDDKKVTIYNRANKLRKQCEFDKAEGVYESIIASYPEDAEAYWGLCLCKYGIEYVDDPATGKKVPTCHRTLDECILEDEDFEQVLENSDSSMIKMYRDKAKEIDRIQQSILEVATKESPYDIFICYKETDDNGQRTEDSVIAQDIFNSLTDKKYRVFFARISLEDKLGKEYEPYIYSALRSSKVMLVVGTKYEYLNAVWVKNEWQRFLELRKKDSEKVLIPCYRDIDAYDLPKEFKNLQSVNLAQVGSVQDLVRNIGKIIRPEEKKVSSSAGASIESLMVRAEDFLADGNWKEAGNYSEKVLDINPRYAKAYLTNLMAQLHISKIDHIDDCYLEIRENPNYRKFMDYADDRLKKELTSHFEKADISRNIYLGAKAEEQTKYYLAESYKELDVANKELKQSKNVFNLFLDIFMMILMAAGILGMGIVWISEFFGITSETSDFVMVSGIIGFLILLFGGAISTMRLFGWSGILPFFGAYFINGFSFCILGVVATIIKFIKKLVERKREVEANRQAVNEITAKIAKYKKALENMK